MKNLAFLILFLLTASIAGAPHACALEEGESAAEIARIREAIESDLGPLEQSARDSAMSSAEKALLFNSGAADGRRLAERGDYAGALRLWRSLVPYMKNPAPVEAELHAAEEALARRDALTSGLETDKKRKFEAPAALADLIGETAGKIESEAAAAKAERERLSASAQDARRRAAESVEKAKRLAARDPAAAAVEIERLIPSLADPRRANELAAALRSLHARRERAREAAENLRADTAKAATPPGLVELLRETDEQLRLAQSQAEKQTELERAGKERKIRYVKGLFESGRASFERGDYEAAIATWSDLVPHLENGPLIQGLIENLKAAYRRYADARREAEDAAASAAKVSAAPDLERTLLQNARRFEKPGSLPARTSAPAKNSAADSDLDQALGDNERLIGEWAARQNEAR